ncbi:MAG: response regulator [Acidobacteria bacterium]|nr:response regulator [Acidobacteriota bacterium]
MRMGSKATGTIVVADDVQANVDLLTGLLTREGYAVLPALDGAAALELVQRESPDLVLSDVLMPKLSGFDLCRRLKEERATRLIPVVLVTALGEREDRIEGINAGADDFLTKPVNAHELKARVRSLVRLKRFTDDLDSAESVILSLGLTVEARDRYTVGHCERMAAYAAAFGVHLDLPDEEVAALHRGGFLHDVGKVGVPDAILLKAGPLTPDESEVMKRHTVTGDAVCGTFRLLRLVRPIVRHHHERLDGSGYPDGLRGDRIPQLAHIMGIVDVYDALTTDRPYRRRLTPEEACAELQREADRGWRHPDLVREFLTFWRGGRMAKLADVLPGPVPFAGVRR